MEIGIIPSMILLIHSVWWSRSCLPCVRLCGLISCTLFMLHTGDSTKSMVRILRHASCYLRARAVPASFVVGDGMSSATATWRDGASGHWEWAQRNVMQSIGSRCFCSTCTIFKSTELIYYCNCTDGTGNADSRKHADFSFRRAPSALAYVSSLEQAPLIAVSIQDRSSLYTVSTQ